MNAFVSSLLIALSSFGLILQDTPKVRTGDLQPLTGAQWTGTLTYLDYRTNKKVSIPSNLAITQSTGDRLSWLLVYEYPDEPKANSKETVRISKDGRTINGETVVERANIGGTTLRIVTEKSGRDDDKIALFRFTYLLNARSFSIKKEVRYEATTDFIERNQYSWKR
jgi:hypothetical protein